MTRYPLKKYLLFTSIFFGISLLCILLGIISVDLLLHHRLATQQGWNYRGYRGKILSAKRDGEYRIACFGASTVYGYFVNQDQTWPYLLEKRLLELKKDASVANLGWNNQGLYGVFHDIKYFENLDYDLAILYNSNADSVPSSIGVANYRAESAFFKLFGYMPILPLYLNEKAMIMKYGIENLNRAYGGKVDEKQSKDDRPVKFRIGVSLGEMNNLFTNINEKLKKYDQEAEVLQKSNGKPYDQYLHYLGKTFDWLISKNKKTIYVNNPGTYNKIQQELVKKLIDEKYKNNVFYLDLSNTVDNSNKELCLDGMHLSMAGNQIVADKIKLFIMDFLREKHLVSI
ncbi:MAG: hypothetical protein HQK53_08375 [Oligoflexia bacterium]|nr:hypothetical protein [Oligoflexia bacterium]